MILENETFDKFGYYAKNLAKASGKNVVVQCDYCNAIFEKKYGKYINARNIINMDCCSSVDCMKLKRKESLLKTYNVETVGQLPQSRYKRTKDEQIAVDLKRKETIRKKYGVDNQFQSEEIKSKIKKTNLERYGNESHMRNDNVKDNLRKTMLKKYGVEHALQLKHNYDKLRQTNLSRYGVDSYAKTDEFKELCNNRRLVFNGETFKEIAEKTGKAYTTVVEQINKYGYDYVIQTELKVTAIEHKLNSWLINLGINFEREKKIDKYRSDFLVNDLCIELNGNYWHCDKFLKDNQYHRNKMLHYNNSGYRAVFFTEDEVINKFDIVASIIKNKLKMCDKVYARKCELVELKKEEAKLFLNENHLMGYGSGKCYGLKYGDKLVSILQFINKKKEIHISRFCTTINTSVVGGFSKLLKRITKDNPNKIVINFVDLRYGTGEHLERLGFVKSREQISFCWTNCKERFHRMKFKGESGYENGLYKIWDCGQAKYVLEL